MKGKELREWMLKRGKSVKENKLGTEPVSEAAAMDDSTGRRAKLSTEVKKGNVFVLDHRYTILRTLGAGAYGLVCSAKDSETNKEVAIKKVQSVFADLTDAKRVLREIRLISSMNHDNILRILDIDEPESYNSFNDVYIVSELMATDMHKLLKSGHPLLDTQRKFFTYQILRALKYIHSASILHRDLKPANILLDNNCDLKICDFGLSRFVDTEQGDFQPMTEYVVTRWYRAPELLLAAEEYSAAIDIWSVGCILVEMYTRAPIFQGRDIKHQIEVICRILGKPTFSEMEGIQNRRAREFIMGLPNTPRQNFKDIVKEITPEAADLIDKLLQFDPKSRISAAEALEHPFLQEFRDPANEITADPSVAMADLEPPNEKKLGRDGIRRLMWDEMLRFHPDARERETPAAIAAERKVAALSEKQ